MQLRQIPWVLSFIGVVVMLSSADEQVPTNRPTTKKRVPNPVLQTVDDVPGLPRVLLIGDSISMGYTLPVRELLKGTANVHRPNTNCGPTTRGLESIDQWLGDRPWDVIHFNWGLHDMKFVGADGKTLTDSNEPGSRRQVSPEEYEQNLRKLVTRLKETNAKLVWCTTTPVPEGAAGRSVEDATVYNEIAKQVMDEHGVAIDDLYSFALPRLATIQLPANVHFSSEGSRELAQQVAASIKTALGKSRDN